MKKADGTKLGYNVSDYSITGEPQRILPDGTKRDPGITVWVNEQLATAVQYDLCDFIGPIDKAVQKEEDKKDPKKAPPEPSQNAFVILKGHGK